MAKSITRRAFAWLLAAALSVAMVPSFALAANADQAGGGSSSLAPSDITTQDDEAAFTIYKKIPISYNSDGTVKDYKTYTLKSYTQTKFEELAAKNTDTLGYIYSKDSGTVVGVDKYVTISALLKDAKYTLAENDVIHFNEAASEYENHTADYAEINSAGKFFPNYSATKDGTETTTDFNAAGAVDAPAIIALSYAKQTVTGLSDTFTAAAALTQTLDSGTTKTTNSYMYCVGETESDYAAKKLLAGSYFGNSLTGMTIYAEPTFDVYEQSATASSAKLVKSYTWSEMLKMATSNDKGLAANYNVNNAIVSTSYIPVQDLIKNAGISFASGDSVGVEAGDGFKTSTTYDALNDSKNPLNYYPNATSEEQGTDDAENVGAVIALNYATGATSTSATTAGAVVSSLLSSTDGFAVGYRWIIGATEADYKAKSNRGNRLVTDPIKMTVTQASISDATVSGLSSATYTGKTISQTPTVTMPDGTKLTSGTDFKAVCTNNTKVGTATVTITGAGSYSGTTTGTFAITQAKNTATAKKTSVSANFKAKNLKKKAATVALPKVTTKFGTAKWSISAKDKKGVLSLKGNNIVVKKKAKKGTYTVKLVAKVAKTANYKAATSKAVTVKVKVK